MAMPVKINRRSDMRYYIADNHFFHRALNTKMDKRGFKSVEEMNDYMIQQWNLKVKKNDEMNLVGKTLMGILERYQVCTGSVKREKIFN